MTGALGSPLYAGLLDDPEIAAHLTAEAEIAAMIRFEAALARVEARLGIIPADAGPAITAALEGPPPTPAELAEGTRAAGVPVPALVRLLRARTGPPHGDYIHWGATSQDVVDTGLVLRLAAILPVLETRLRALVATLAAEAERHADLLMAGRTRTQIATPTTLGLRIAGWMAPLARCLDRLAELRPRVLVLQFGGATGTLSILGAKGPEAMDALAAELGLHAPAKPWCAERDGIVELAHWLAMVSGLLARMAGDLALMGRSEIAELAAGTGGGSSTMPQKANPVGAETLGALARFAAGQSAAMQATLLHHEERDGAPWMAEWLILPPLILATGTALRHAAALAATLRPDPGRMRANMALGGGTIEAEALAFALARHMPLSEAQDLVKSAVRAMGDAGGTLRETLSPLAAARGLALPAPGDEATLAPARAFVRRATAAARAAGTP